MLKHFNISGATPPFFFIPEETGLKETIQHLHILPWLVSFDNTMIRINEFLLIFVMIVLTITVWIEIIIDFNDWDWLAVWKYLKAAFLKYSTHFNIIRINSESSTCFLILISVSENVSRDKTMLLKGYWLWTHSRDHYSCFRSGARNARIRC